MADDLADYRCVHGKLFLGCADPDCEEQNAYLEANEALMAKWYQREKESAYSAVRAALGMDT